MIRFKPLDKSSWVGLRPWRWVRDWTWTILGCRNVPTSGPSSCIQSARRMAARLHKEVEVCMSADTFTSRHLARPMLAFSPTLRYLCLTLIYEGGYRRRRSEQIA